MSSEKLEGSRANLKRIFSKGVTPKQEEFHLLIDSVLNLNDDNLTSLPLGGLKVAVGDGGVRDEYVLLEFIQRGDGLSKDFLLVRQEPSGGMSGVSLGFKGRQARDREHTEADPIFIEESGNVGVGNHHPRFLMDVGGTVGMQARQGTFLEGTFPADGRWHDLLGRLDQRPERGYYAMEVMAYTLPQRGSGQYSIVHASCVGAYPMGNSWFLEGLGMHNRRGITMTRNWYGTRRHRLDLRWSGSQAAPTLEIRTRKNMADTEIRFRITNLIPEQYLAPATPVDSRSNG